MAHVADRLQALLSGSLPSAEREQADAHLAACSRCQEERDLLLSAQALITRLPAQEPRIGFAAKVAFAARDQRRSPLSRWLRWMLSGAGAAAVAAAAAAFLVPSRPALPGGDVVKVAQRLELFEDLAVLQNREALEDIEVVSVLHTLEARP